MVVKRGSRKHSSNSSNDSNSSFSSSAAQHLNHVLIDNFVRLQKVLVTNVEKMDMLNNNVSRLLQIFEVSAKSFAEKNYRPGGVVGSGDLQKEAEFLGKLNTLLDQNKTIAKGLSLLGDDMKEKLYGDTPSANKGFVPPTPSSIPAPRQRFERIDISGMDGLDKRSRPSV